MADFIAHVHARGRRPLAQEASWHCVPFTYLW